MPPAGNGRFDQLDIISALAAGKYLTGPYAAIGKGGSLGDGQTSVVYDAATGEVAVDAPDGVELTSINVDSAARIFTGDPAANLGGIIIAVRGTLSIFAFLPHPIGFLSSRNS